MSKVARERRKRAKARKAQIAAQKRSRADKRRRTLNLLRRGWRGVSLGWKALGVILVLLGAVSQVYFFIWRLSVTPGDTLKVSDPFATMFTLKNEGQFALHDITFACVLNRAEYEHDVVLTDNLAMTDEFNVPFLEGYAQTSTPCFMKVEVVDYKVISIDVSLAISYRPSFYPFRRTKLFRFRAKPKDAGGVVWYPISSENKF